MALSVSHPVSTLELNLSGWYWCLLLIRDAIQKEPYNILYLIKLFFRQLCHLQKSTSLYPGSHYWYYKKKKIYIFLIWNFIRVRVFNATFNNISVISWQSVLLVEETGENHQPATSHWQTWSHNVVVNTTTIGSRPRRNSIM